MSFIFNKNKEKKWKNWEEWQIKNGYKNCPILDYYESYYKIIMDENNPYYQYFGKFSYFITRKDNIIYDLLQLYDLCKGYARYFTGDPYYIKLIREYSKTNDIKNLHKIDFNEFFYNYKKIHAYVVSIFSLSTLIMRIISFYLAKKGKMIEYGVKPFIDLDNDYKTIIYQNIEIFQRCNNCNRISEKIWGVYTLCYDCYLTKICNKCGKKKEMIYPSNIKLPTCDHCLFLKN